MVWIFLLLQSDEIHSSRFPFNLRDTHPACRLLTPQFEPEKPDLLITNA